MSKHRNLANAAKALRAISRTGHGHCWYCDAPLPAANRAIRGGWNVRCVEGGRVRSIILVCPMCLGQKKEREFAEEDFRRILSPRVFDAV